MQYLYVFVRNGEPEVRLDDYCPSDRADLAYIDKDLVYVYEVLAMVNGNVEIDCLYERGEG